MFIGMTPAELTAYLHRHIPLSAAMAVTVQDCDESRVELRAPLAPNINHRQTAFGGSLATLATLSGWALLFVALRSAEMEARLVIQQASSRFTEPLESDLIAESRLPEAEWPRFLLTLDRHRRARIRIESEVRGPDGRVGLRQSGDYVALRPV